MKAINGVSRRAFLGLGATAAAGAAAMGLIGCSPKADSKSSTTDSALSLIHISEPTRH